MFIAIKKKMKNQKGFTLIELMVVIAILGILAAIAIPRLSASSNTARLAKIQADLATIESGISLYQATTGALPVDDVSGNIAVLVPNYIAAIPASPTTAVTGTGGVSIAAAAKYEIVGGRAAIVGAGGANNILYVEQVK